MTMDSDTTERASAPTQADLDRRAVEYVARRMREDADVYYVLGLGTEAHHRLVAAMVAAHGGSEEAMAALLATPLRPYAEREAEIPRLRRRVEALEELLDTEAPWWRDDAAARGVDQ